MQRLTVRGNLRKDKLGNGRIETRLRGRNDEGVSLIRLTLSGGKVGARGAESRQMWMMWHSRI